MQKYADIIDSKMDYLCFVMDFFVGFLARLFRNVVLAGNVPAILPWWQSEQRSGCLRVKIMKT